MSKDLAEVRESFSVSFILEQSNMKEYKEGADKEARHFKCPLHESAATGDVWAMHSLEARGFRFFCHQCKAEGDSIDLHRLMHKTPNATASLFEMLEGSGKVRAEFAGAGSVERTGETRFGETKLIESGTKFIETPKTFPLDKSLSNGLAKLAQFNALEQFARDKRWLVDTQEGQYPLNVRDRVFQKEPGLEFPKLLLTEQARSVFGVSESMVGVKYRLLNNTYQGGKPLRWRAPKTYLQSIPWEIDSHESAQVLMVVIGPGSALRLHNELNERASVHETLGLQTHILGLDSYWNLAPGSIVRAPSADGTGLVSLYSGYRKVILIADEQMTPVQQDMIQGSLKIIKKCADEGAQVKFKILAAAGVGEYFDRDGTIKGFSLECKFATEV